MLSYTQQTGKGESTMKKLSNAMMDMMMYMCMRMCMCMRCNASDSMGFLKA